jgi:WD40 repeat protein
VHARSGPTPSRLADRDLFASRNMMNKAPSVQHMNTPAALKTSGTITSLLEQVASSGPRSVQLGQVSHQSIFDIPSTSSNTPRKSPSMPASAPFLQSRPRETHGFTGIEANGKSGLGAQHTPQTQAEESSDMEDIAENLLVSGNQLSRSPYFSGAAFVEDDMVSVMSDASLTAEDVEEAWRITSTQPVPDIQQPSYMSSTTKPVTIESTQLKIPQPTQVRIPQPTKDKTPESVPAKYTSQFSEEEDHLLIFLKEVKKLKWKQITTEFQKYYPSRPYHSIQSRYTTKTNKRDRSKDPAVLKLPPQWAQEASIDWAAVQTDNVGPRDRVRMESSHHDASALSRSRPTIIRETTEPEYSSGADSGIRQARPRRAPPVNYDVRKRTRRQGDDLVEIEVSDAFPGGSADVDTPMRSRSPADSQLVAPSKAHAVINEPLSMDFDVNDAEIALITDKKASNSVNQKLPYLRASQRLSIQNTPDDFDWDQVMSREWQGSLLHVDFSPAELAQAERAIAKICQNPTKSRHSTQRRQFRSMLKGLTEAKLLQLTHTMQRRLPARNSHSISAFLRDAQEGRIAEAPHILRHCAARPQRFTSSTQIDSTSHILRQRELGVRSRRGWQTASSALTCQMKDKLTDSLGPLAAWTGASSDIHTLAWSQDGETFAAGAVAVTDADSMQYNRPNNLLFGVLSAGTIHELAEHTMERRRTETGANSSHAMFASQDPKLYTTVTSVAFAPSGRLMYSAGYDESVCVWDLDQAFSQPSLASKFRHKAEVEMMVANPVHDGILATAAKRTSGAAVKLITLDEEYPTKINQSNFHSSKAISRSDLKILPQALRFEPSGGNHLLAGFGATVQDAGFDTTGDLCFWDIRTETQLPIHGSGKNVFDVVFNPNQRHMPRFAAGCVAGGNVNRGTRSVIRLYDQRASEKFGCPLEIECRALDMNDVTWSSQDEHLIAAGCTDGRVYVWDLRNSGQPMKTLAHGPSLMPLQDGIPHERTDMGIRFLSWGENATRLYSGSSDGVVKVWDVHRSEEDTFIKDIIALDSGIMAGAFSPDYSKLLLGEVNGSVNILEVGRDDCAVKDTQKLRYVPFKSDDDSIAGDKIEVAPVHESGVAEGDHLLQSEQLQLAPTGNLPIMQVVQGPNYAGPFDQSVDAPYLREQALKFQLDMMSQPGPQCDLSNCRDNIVKVTSEEIGDSGRSVDRIPDELRRQWMAIDATTCIMPGKSKCTHCGRPARPSLSNNGNEDAAKCERCSFECFRCHAVNHIDHATEKVICDSCAGVWEIGALGYECVEQPLMRGTKLDVPSLRRFGWDLLEEKMDEQDTTYGDDELNALTDYYFSLAIDRPESPPL